MVISYDNTFFTTLSLFYGYDFVIPHFNIFPVWAFPQFCYQLLLLTIFICISESIIH